MKKILILIALIFLPITFFAQDESVSIFYKVAEQTCEYLQSEEVQGVYGSELSNKLGVFLIKKYNEFQIEFIEAGFELDFLEGEKAGAALGEKIGLTMVNICPNALVAFSEGVKVEDKETVNEFYIKGKLIDIEGEEFSTIIIKDSEGKIQKFLWLSNFAGSDALIYNKSIEEIEVEILYRNIECYSPKLKDYIIRKEILEIEYL